MIIFILRHIVIYYVNIIYNIKTLCLYYGRLYDTIHETMHTIPIYTIIILQQIALYFNYTHSNRIRVHCVMV